MFIIINIVNNDRTTVWGADGLPSAEGQRELEEETTQLWKWFILLILVILLVSLLFYI